MIGSCDCCDRTNVPVGKIVIYGIKTTACFVCQSHGIEPDPDPYGELNDKIPVSYHDLVERLKECYEQRELPTWGEIHDSAEAIKHLMTLNRLMAPGISSWKERAERAESVTREPADNAAHLTAELLRIKNRFDRIFNNVLCDMKPGWDDSIEGFNKAWGVANDIFQEEIGRAAQLALAGSKEEKR